MLVGEPDDAGDPLISSETFTGPLVVLASACNHATLIISLLECNDDVDMMYRCQTRSWSRTMQRCRSISWLKTRMRRTALTMRLCMTSASVPSSWPLRPTVTSTTLSRQPCLVSPLVSASQARSEVNSSLSKLLHPCWHWAVFVVDRKEEKNILFYW